jgi:rhodanese-related sulfurtransferase
MTARTARSGVDRVLAEARERLARLEPRAAYERVRAGAVLIDIRPTIYRATEGSIPGAFVIERNDLEWRLDPASDARLPIATYDLEAIVLCNEGYASSLAAASLQDLGLRAATDLVGGFRAWQAAGLPVADGGANGRQRAAGRRPGSTAGRP